MRAQRGEDRSAVFTPFRLRCAPTIFADRLRTTGQALASCHDLSGTRAPVSHNERESGPLRYRLMSVPVTTSPPPLRPRRSDDRKAIQITALGRRDANGAELAALSPGPVAFNSPGTHLIDRIRDPR
jgi:hypothetical protein